MTIRIHSIGLCACVAALLCQAPAVIAQPAAQPGIPPAAALFVPAQPPQHPVRLPPQAVQSREVTVDTKALAALRAGEAVQLDPLPGLPLTGLVDRASRRSPTRYTVAGNLAEDPLGFFIIVVEEDAVAGIIQSPAMQSLLRITYRGEGVHAVSRLDPARFGDCGVQGPGRNPLSAAPAPQDAAIQPLDASSLDVAESTTLATCPTPQPVFDVLIAYTSLARQAAGGTSAINAECQLAIDTANQGFSNSLIDARYRLVYRLEVSYNESGTFDDHLSRLNDPSDGILDNLHTLRNSYKADFVSLWVNDDDGGTICGLANCTVSESDAFSVVNWDCAVSNFSFHHELGHNQGCAHNREDAGSGCAEDSYSYGWRWYGNSRVGYRSVMAYNNSSSSYTRVNYFSNPYVYYDGQPTGVAVGQTNESYNAKTIHDRRFTFENHRYSGFDVWVDLAAGGFEFGSFFYPFNTVAEGQNAIVVSSSASETPVLHIKAGATKVEAVTLNKPMIVTSCGGAARIGG